MLQKPMELINENKWLIIGLVIAAVVSLLILQSNGLTTPATQTNTKSQSQTFEKIQGTISETTRIETPSDLGSPYTLITTNIQAQNGQYQQISLKGEGQTSNQPYLIAVIPKTWAPTANQIQSTAPFTTIVNDPIIKFSTEYNRPDGFLVATQIFTPTKTAGPIDIFVVKDAHEITFHELNNLAALLSKIAARGQPLRTDERTSIQEWINQKDWTRIEQFADNQVLTPSAGSITPTPAIQTESYVEIYPNSQGTGQSTLELPFEQLYGLSGETLNGFLDARLTYDDPRVSPGTFAVKYQGKALVFQTDPSGFRNEPDYETDSQPVPVKITVTVGQTASQTEAERTRTLYVLPYTGKVDEFGAQSCTQSADIINAQIQAMLDAKSKAGFDGSGSRKLFTLTAGQTFDPTSVQRGMESDLPTGPGDAEQANTPMDPAQQAILLQTPCGPAIESVIEKTGSSSQIVGNIENFNPEQDDASTLTVDVRLIPDATGKTYTKQITLGDFTT